MGKHMKSLRNYLLAFVLAIVVSLSWSAVGIVLNPQIQDPFNFGWFTGSTFVRVSDSQFAVTDNIFNQAIFAVGRPIRYRDAGGASYYGRVTVYAAGTVTLRGAPMDATHDAELDWGIMEKVTVLAFSDPGQWSDALDNTLLRNDLLLQGGYIWKEGDARIIGFDAIETTADTGANEPHVNVSVGGNPVCTLNANAGPVMVDPVAQVATGADMAPANYVLAMNSAIELRTDAVGSNDDSANLMIYIIVVRL